MPYEPTFLFLYENERMCRKWEGGWAAGLAGVELAQKEYVRKQISSERYPASPYWPIKKTRDHEVQVKKYVSVSGNFHSPVLECIHVLF